MKQCQLIICACFVLSACASLPDSVTERDTISVLSVPAEFQVQQAQNSQIIGGLLDVFKDEQLNTLVRQSLTQNLDIQLAAKQLEGAGFNADAQWGNLLPQVTGDFASDRSKSAQGKPESILSPSLDVSWELDLWGKLRDQKNSVDAKAMAQAEAYQFARDSIAAQVMQGWFDVVTAERLVALEQSRLSNLQISAENSKQNYKAGLGQLDDLDAVNRDIAQSKATLAANIDNRNTVIRTLQVLMGQYPGAKMALEYELPALIAPPAAECLLIF